MMLRLFTKFRRSGMLISVCASVLVLSVLLGGKGEVVHAVPLAQMTGFDCNNVSEIPSTECSVLLSIYEQTGGANWQNSDGWLEDNTPCDWYGLRCGAAGHVSHIVLDQNGLTGEIPARIGDLSRLTWLQLNGNQLSGAIPASLGQLAEVTWLRLESNQLSGAIPAEIGSMRSLGNLYLSDNLLSGAIPAELGNLSALRKLYLSDNQLSGAVPSTFGLLSELEFLLINGTDLGGPLPLELSNLENLNFFHLLGTDLCEPNDAPFRVWIEGIDSLYSARVACSDGSTATPQPTVVQPTVQPTVEPTPSTVSQPSGGAELCQGLITDRNNYPMTPLDKPEYLRTVVDPEFGTTIRRITDIEATVSGERAVIKPMYNTIQAWNANESYMILYQRSVGHQLLDGVTYEYIRNLNIRPADLEEVFWHFTDPDILFYVEPYYVNDANPGQRLMRYRVSSDTSEVVRSFENVCTQDEGIEGGNDVQMMSWDSDLIGLRCVNQPGRFFNYQLSTDTVSPVITSGAGNDYEPWYAPQPAPSGNLMILDNDVLDANLNVVRELNMSGTEHSTLGRFANGNDGLFTVAFAEGPQGGCGPGALIGHDLTDGTCRTLVGQENGYPYPPSGTHMSALSHLNPGWVAVSMVGVANWGQTDEAGQELLDNELLLVDTRPGGDVCRVGHHRSFARGAPRGYWGEPHVVISPSGTRLLFGSDWEGGTSVDSYVIELPSYDGGQPAATPAATMLPEATTTPMPMTPSPFPTIEPTIAPTVLPTAMPTLTPVPTATPMTENESSGTISGQVFEDVNGNGNYDAGEPALTDITVVLIDVSTAGQTTTISSETDETGAYRFVNLQNVDYRLSFIMPAGYAYPQTLSNVVRRNRVGSVDAPYQSEGKKVYLPFVND